MIAKEKTSPVPSDKFGRAGHDAEMQMAFYLRRAFAEAADVYVYNDLRLIRNGEVAQIDHLIFHRYGFIIVESKSVVGTITVNAQGEFTRTFDGITRGMPSPIRQAKLQAELLLKLLNDHKTQLRRKVLFGLQQGEFGIARIKTLVAISDRGIIQRQQCDPPELCKAEQVAERIREAIQRHTHASSFVGVVKASLADRKTAEQLDKDALAAYTDEEMDAICRFLSARHTPLEMNRANREPVAPPVQRPEPTPPPLPNPTVGCALNCRHCQSYDVSALHGRYGYYLKCRQCQGNTSIDQTCTNCNEKARIQKSGPNFTRVCQACGIEALVHQNLPIAHD
jgi:hypothetical protein